MNKINFTVKGKDFDFPYPETMTEVEQLVPNEDDRLELIRFALHHRIRSAAGMSLNRHSEQEVQRMIDSYRYRRRNL